MMHTALSMLVVVPTMIQERELATAIILVMVDAITAASTEARAPA